MVPGALAFKRLGSQLSEQMLTFLQTHRDLLPLVKGGGVLVHSDFKPVNLLWSEVNRLTVLDWEFAHSGHALFDFGILLRHYLDFPLRLNDLEKGYVEAGGSLPDNWLHIARLLDFVNIIQLLNTSGERPELFTSLIKSAQLTISAWDNLDSRLNLPC